MDEALGSVVVHVELLLAMEHLDAANALKLRIMTAKISEKQMRRRFATAMKQARSIRNKLILPSVRFDKSIRRGIPTFVRSINTPSGLVSEEEACWSDLSAKYISEQGVRA
jgi:hypothetical protein